MLTRATLAGLALLAVAAILLALAWREPARMDSAETGISARAVASGATKYRDYCAGCHGVAGLGIPGLAPALNSPDFFARRLDEIGYAGSMRSYIEATVATGRPVSQNQYGAIMPAWSRAYGGSLRDDEIRDIASFILNWDTTSANNSRASAATETPLLPPTQEVSVSVERGKAVFYGPAGCLGCHGVPGQGGASGPDMAGIAQRAVLQAPGLTAEQVIRQSILAPGAVIASGCQSETCPDIMPRDYSTRLRQTELDALVGYLLTLKDGGPVIDTPTPTEIGERAVILTVTPIPTVRPPRGNPDQGRVLFDENCAPCHGDRGKGQSASSLAAVFASIDPYQYVRAAMDQGVPGTTMPAWGKDAGGHLSDEQLDDIAAYVAGWAKEQWFPTAQDDGRSSGTSSAWIAALLFLILAVGGVAVLFLAQRPSEAKQPDDR